MAPPTQAAVDVVEVPFIDLAPVNRQVKNDVLMRLAELIDQNEFGSGQIVSEFEARFATFCGASGCVGLSSGLDALRLALSAAGLEPGDHVLVPAHTFVATFEAISQLGAVPVPVDVSLSDYNIDVDAAAAAVTSAATFVVPVHLYGQLADLESIEELAGRNGLKVIEDAAQAHGAHRAGRRPGDHSLAATFSFYPAKNLGAMGDAGAVISGDAGLLERVSMLREHGQARKYIHEVAGWTARLDAFQAAVLIAKLELIDEWTRQRREIAQYYLAALDGVGDLHLPPVAAKSEPVWHLFVVTTTDPESLARFLGARGIGTARHYPQPPHLSPAYRHLGYDHGSFPVTEQLARSSLSLPVFPGMTEAQLESVCNSLRCYFEVS